MERKPKGRSPAPLQGGKLRVAHCKNSPYRWIILVWLTIVGTLIGLPAGMLVPAKDWQFPRNWSR